jgi:hypothetical protein
MHIFGLENKQNRIFFRKFGTPKLGVKIFFRKIFKNFIIKKFASKIYAAAVIWLAIAPNFKVNGRVIRPRERASRTIHPETDPELLAALARGDQVSDCLKLVLAVD